MDEILMRNFWHALGGIAVTFDIYQLDNIRDAHEDEAISLLEDYEDAIVEQFVNSPEGEAYLVLHPDIGYWARSLIDFGYNYEGFTLPKMQQNDVELLLEHIFPRKISLRQPEDAEETVPELIAFWQFLKREYQLKQADAILKYLNKVKPKYPAIMNDSSRFGMAKSFFMAGNQAGFDMTTQAGLNAFQQEYNAKLLTNPENPLFNSRQDSFPMLEPGEEGVISFGAWRGTKQKRSKTQEKKKRSIAKASRKANRKKK